MSCQVSEIEKEIPEDEEKHNWEENPRRKNDKKFRTKLLPPSLPLLPEKSQSIVLIDGPRSQFLAPFNSDSTTSSSFP